MQLSRIAPVAAMVVCSVSVHSRAALAQAVVAAGSSAFFESGGPLNMTVVIPEVRADVPLGDNLAVNAAWTADVISGASVAVVDAPAASVDAISAASLQDVRNVLGGGVRMQDGQSSLAAGYRYGIENDYRSHAFDVTAHTDLFERNTSLEITYARAFDHVCDGPSASDAVLKARLDSSDGCFAHRTGADGKPVRRVAALDVNSFEAAWTQALGQMVNMQWTASASLLHGLQANPYRAVVIGRTAAQEHHPENRARYALAAGLRVWIAPWSGALQPLVRAYRDTWNVRSLSAELGYEQSLGQGVRIRGRGRYYVQSGASFYSDDYVLHPRGRYFTGDRELSSMRSVLLGAQCSWTVPSDTQGEVLGFLDGLELSIKGDWLKSWFPEFHYDRAAVPNDAALIGSLSLLAGF
jgi:hypothetical protein